MIETALLDVRVLPWRPRARVMKRETLRDFADPPLILDDLAGLVIGLAVWLLILIAAPVLVLVLAAALLSVELPLVVGLGVLLLVVRFTGLLPWSVVIVDRVSGAEQHESYRSLWGAVLRIRSINHDRRINVRWAWT